MFHFYSSANYVPDQLIYNIPNWSELFFHLTQEAVFELSASRKMLLDCYWVDREIFHGNWKKCSS